MNQDGDDEVGERPMKRKIVYKDHLPPEELQRGMREGRFYQGGLRTNRYNPSRATITCESLAHSILISGEEP